MGIAAQGDPHLRPVPAQAADQVAHQGADLGAGRRRAATEQHRHRPAGGGLIDVDRQEAVAVVVAIEQRELLPAMRHVAGLVQVQGDRLGWLREAGAEQVDQGGHHPRHRGARGSVLQPAHGRLRAQRPAALRRPAERQLEGRIVTQGVAVVGILVAGGNGEHPQSQHLGEGVLGALRIAPVPQARRQTIGDPQPAFDLAQQQDAAVRRQPATVERDDNPLARNRWQNEGESAILGHDGLWLSQSGAEDLGRAAFLHHLSGLRHTRHLVYE